MSTLDEKERKQKSLRDQPVPLHEGDRTAKAGVVLNLESDRKDKQKI